MILRNQPPCDRHISKIRQTNISAVNSIYSFGKPHLRPEPRACIFFPSVIFSHISTSSPTRARIVQEPHVVLGIRLYAAQSANSAICILSASCFSPLPRAASLDSSEHCRSYCVWVPMYSRDHANRSSCSIPRAALNHPALHDRRRECE